VKADTATAAAVTSSASSVHRIRVKSTSSLQHPQPIVAQHFVIPPPASVPSHRRSTSSQSSTPPTPAAMDTLMPACPTGWARFDMSPLNEVTQDASSAVCQTTEDTLPFSDVEPRTSDSQTPDFAKFPSSSAEDDQQVDHPAITEGQMSNDKFSDSFLASRDSTGFEDDVIQADSAVASSSFELMSPSSDKDSISLPSPEAPPPPLPANVPTTELPSEPPLPPPRPRAHASSQVGPSVDGHGDVPVTCARAESVHSSPVQGSPAAAAVHDTEDAQPPVTATVTAVSSVPPPTSSVIPQSRFTEQPSSTQLSSDQTCINDTAQFSLVFPSDDATPPPLPPRNIPVSSNVPKQHLMRGISLPASGRIHSVDDVPPPPPPRRSLSKPVRSSQAVDPFAPIPVSIPASLAPVREQAAVAVTLALPSNCPVVETTIAPLPRPRPHLRHTEAVASEAASSTVLPTSSGSSSPWHSVSTPPITEPVPVDPFSNVDPFAGSVSPDDPFAEPSLDGMLSDLCHDFDTDTLSVTAFRTRAVTIDSVSSDIYDTGSVASTSGHHRDASSVLDESRSTASPAVPPNIESGGTGCLVDLNTTDDVNTAKWQPFSEAASGLGLYRDLQDVWYSSASVNWKPTSTVTLQPSDVTGDIFGSSVSNTVVRQQDIASMQASDKPPAAGILDAAVSSVAVHQPGAGTEAVTVSSLVVTDTETNHCSVTSSSSQHNATDVTDSMAHSAHAASELPAGLPHTTSSAEHRDCSSDAVFGKFGKCFTSSPAVCVTAGGRNDVAVTCSSELSTASTVPSTDDDQQQITNNSADLLNSDAQVISLLLV